jgi:cobalamin biosynthesis Mg chelatase CobN
LQLQEYREDPVANQSLRASIVGVLSTSGLHSDCPFKEATQENEAVVLREEDVDTVDGAEFDAYMSRLYEYLSVVENRLFSEGLHTLGEPPSADQVRRVAVLKDLWVLAEVRLQAGWDFLKRRCAFAYIVCCGAPVRRLRIARIQVISWNLMGSMALKALGRCRFAGAFS